MNAPHANGLGNAAVAAGWYVDPNDRANWRWWDGIAWTDHVSAIVAPEHRAPTPKSIRERTSPLLVWPLPSTDAPLFERNAYSKSVTVSFRAATRAAFLRRWPRLVIAAIVEVVGAIITPLRGVPGMLVQYGNSHPEFHERDEQLERIGGGAIAQTYREIRSDARDAPWESMLRNRGLHDANEITLQWHEFARLPSLRTHSTSAPRWYGTDLLAGMAGACGEFVAIRRDEGGNDQGHEFRLFAAFHIPPRAGQRHAQVAVRPKGLLNGPSFAGARVEQFESIAVARELRIEVSAATDPLATRELFGPRLLARLAEYPVAWDQRGGTLLVYQDSPAEPGLVFDEFVRSATAVARAYWGEQG